MFNFGRYRNILFINDTEDDYHFGCTATSKTIKNELKKSCRHLDTIPVQDIWKISNPPNSVQEFFSKDFMKRYINNNKLYISKIKKADKIVINGEGTILGFEGRPGTQNLLFIAYIAKKLGKNVSIINHSCYPLLSPYFDNVSDDIVKIYKTVYSQLDYCCVRDIRSLAILNKIGIKNVNLGFDCLPLYINNYYKNTEIPYESGSYILLSGGIEFAKIFKNFLDKNVLDIAKTFNKKIVFLMSDTHVKSYDDLQLLEVINDFNQSSDINVEIYWAKTVDEFLTLIQNSFFQITGRFHHSIAALYFGTPFLVYSSHSPKTDIFNDFKMNIKTLNIEKDYDIPLLMRECINGLLTVDNSAILNLARNNFLT